MPIGFVQNQAGNFIEPTLESTQAAVEAVALELPTGDASWSNVTMVNAPGADSYPVASFSYLLVDKELSENPTITEQKASALVDFIDWGVTEGQQFAPELAYVPLPENVVQLNEETLNGMTFNGNPVFNSTGGNSTGG